MTLNDYHWTIAVICLWKKEWSQPLYLVLAYSLLLSESNLFDNCVILISKYEFDPSTDSRKRALERI